MNKRLFALGRLKKGQMNKTEARYAEHLKELKYMGFVEEYWFEQLTLKLAEGSRYTPDFMVLMPDGRIELHEVKGSPYVFRDDAKDKVKQTATHFPFIMKVCYPIKKSDDWEIVEY